MIVINEQDLPYKIHQILELFSTSELEKMENGKYALAYKKIEEIIRETPGLEACPFCGVMPKLDLVEESDGLFYEILCINKQCPVLLKTTYNCDSTELIEQWNKRGGEK